MAGSSERHNAAIYWPISPINLDDWTSTIGIRSERLLEFVSPKVGKKAAEMPPEAFPFLVTAVDKLALICRTAFTNQGNPQSEIPTYCILDELPNNEPRYNFNGERGIHNATTLIAAQSLVDALCPELGLGLTDDLETSLQKARVAQILGYADLYSHYTNNSPD